MKAAAPQPIPPLPKVAPAQLAFVKTPSIDSLGTGDQLAREAQMGQALATRVLHPPRPKASVNYGYADLVSAAWNEQASPIPDKDASNCPEGHPESIASPHHHQAIPRAAPSSASAEPARSLQFKLAIDLAYEEEERESAVQRKGDPCRTGGAPIPPDDEAGPEQRLASPSEIHAIARAGVEGASEPLPHLDRIQPLLAPHDLRNVRTVTGGAAGEASTRLGARAYTLGDRIAFREAPDVQLAAHEAAHVVQQRHGVSVPNGLGQMGDAYERAADGFSERAATETSPSPSMPATTAPDVTEAQSPSAVQLMVHSGTPTNAHNWRIPLPPWIAGTIAHGQIAAMLGIPPHFIPRATKVFRGIPNPPVITPNGFADLWQLDPSAVRIAEIKSTQTGEAVAHAEADHYVIRHKEWLSRAPHKASDDVRYFMSMGGALLSGSLLDLSSRTGTDLNLGVFWGDPMKDLHIEADNLGAVLYWCTGPGLPFSPIWYPLFRRLAKALEEQLRKARQTLAELLEGIVAGAAWVMERISKWVGSVVEWGQEHSRVLAALLLILIALVAIVLIILSILAEPPSGGTSTVPLLGSIAALAAAATGLMVLLGIGSPQLPNASTSIAKMLAPEEPDSTASSADYEREADSGNWPASPVAANAMIPSAIDEFFQALAPIGSPLALFQQLAGNLQTIPPGSAGQLRLAAAALERAGDPATAAFLRQQLAEYGMG